jgi:hypothetical protein
LLGLLSSVDQDARKNEVNGVAWQRRAAAVNLERFEEVGLRRFEVP